MKKEITLNVGSGIGQMRFDLENHEGIDIDKITKIVSPETDFILHKKSISLRLGNIGGVND